MKGWVLVARVTGRGCRQLHRSSLAVLLKPRLSLITTPPLDLRYIQTFTAATLPPEAGVPQLLKLLTLPGRATVQVSAATISLMMKTQPALTRSHLLQPLTAPLRDMAAGLSTSEICSDIFISVVAGDFTESEPFSADLGRAAEITIGSLHRVSWKFCCDFV